MKKSLSLILSLLLLLGLTSCGDDHKDRDVVPVINNVYTQPGKDNVFIDVSNIKENDNLEFSLDGGEKFISCSKSDNIPYLFSYDHNVDKYYYYDNETQTQVYLTNLSNQVIVRIARDATYKASEPSNAYSFTLKKFYSNNDSKIRIATDSIDIIGIGQTEHASFMEGEYQKQNYQVSYDKVNNCYKIALKSINREQTDPLFGEFSKRVDPIGNTNTYEYKILNQAEHTGYITSTSQTTYIKDFTYVTYNNYFEFNNSDFIDFSNVNRQGEYVPVLIRLKENSTYYASTSTLVYVAKYKVSSSIASNLNYITTTNNNITVSMGQNASISLDTVKNSLSLFVSSNYEMSNFNSQTTISSIALSNSASSLTTADINQNYTLTINYVGGTVTYTLNCIA